MSNSAVTLLSVSQVAERLGVTEAGIRRWIIERKITTIKIGRLIRIPSTEIDRLVSIGTRPARVR
jgi:excisionase family DNA binding protein